jgi:hypothetical protein
MRVPRLLARCFAATGVAAFALFVQGCSDSGPTAPPAPAVELAPTDANGQLLDDLLGGTLSAVSKTVNALSCKKLPAYFGSAVIGKDGGAVYVGPHRLVVPKGALSGNTLISGYAPSDKNARVTFQPHGLQFAQPANLTMSYAHCSIVSSLLPKRIAYVQGGTLNLLYYLPSLDNLGQQEVSSKLNHFSDYVIAW